MPAGEKAVIPGQRLAHGFGHHFQVMLAKMSMHREGQNGVGGALAKGKVAASISIAPKGGL